MITILHGDCIEKMRELPDESVHLIVTSPPYWGLRDYKIPNSTWPDGWVGTFGLEPTPELYIEHAVMIFREAKRVLRRDGTLWVNLGDSYSNVSKWGGKSGGKNETSAGGGYQGQRVKRTNGRPMLNGRGQPNGARGGHEGKHAFSSVPDIQPNRAGGCKAGDLVGIPWRVAFALQADGWFLRRDNIWFKKNPMPESVSGWRWERHRVKIKAGWTKENHPSAQGGSDKSRCDAFGTHNGTKPSTHAAEFVDCSGCGKCTPNGGLVLRKGNWRCTTAHEYVFQFSKSDSYFCDAEAARERTTGNAHGRGAGVNPKAEGLNSRMHRERTPDGATNKPNSSRSGVRGKQNASFSAAVTGLVINRNRRSVWPIATAPYRDAHFATFPPALVRPIIRAASPTQCCGKCRAAYAPIVQRGEPRKEQQLACGSNSNGEYLGIAQKEFNGTGAENASEVKARILAGMVEKIVIGCRPTCRCGCKLSVRPVVLDMFGGSGTVGQVAEEEGRDAILIEISEAYIPLIRQRCAVTAGLAL
jgi:DNA modification methylase